MGVKRCTFHKMACNSKTTGHTANRANSLILVTHISSTLDLVVFRSFWGAFDIVVSKYHASARKWLVVEEKRGDIWELGTLERHICITFVFLLCFVLLQNRATVMARAFVVRLSVELVFSDTTKRINVKFWGKVHGPHIFGVFLVLYLRILLFYVLFSFGLLNSRVTVIAMASFVRHPSVVVRPSVEPVFSDAAKWINVKFWGKVPIHHISRPFFFSSKYLIFDFCNDFSSFSLTWDHMDWEISNDISSENTQQIH